MANFKVNSNIALLKERTPSITDKDSFRLGVVKDSQPLVHVYYALSVGKSSQYFHLGETKKVKHGGNRSNIQSKASVMAGIKAGTTVPDPWLRGLQAIDYIDEICKAKWLELFKPGCTDEDLGSLMKKKRYDWEACLEKAYDYPDDKAEGKEGTQETKDGDPGIVQVFESGTVPLHDTDLEVVAKAYEERFKVLPSLQFMRTLHQAALEDPFPQPSRSSLWIKFLDEYAVEGVDDLEDYEGYVGREVASVIKTEGESGSESESGQSVEREVKAGEDIGQETLELDENVPSISEEAQEDQRERSLEEAEVRAE